MAGCTAHARNSHIFTSGLKSDVTIVFLDPDFIQDAEISAIRVHQDRHEFSGPLGLKWSLGAK